MSSQKQPKTLIKNSGYFINQWVLMKGDHSLQHLMPQENIAFSYLRLDMIVSNDPGIHRNHTIWTKGKIHVYKLRHLEQI